VGGLDGRISVPFVRWAQTLSKSNGMLHDFELAGRRVRLWQGTGESYEHVLMKALGYAMLVPQFPDLAIERPVGLRYKPDLVAVDEWGRIVVWGECGAVGTRKIGWLLKHAGVEKLFVFKIGADVAQLAEELRTVIDVKHRAPGRLMIVNFVPEIVALTRSRRIARVARNWYTEVSV